MITGHPVALPLLFRTPQMTYSWKNHDPKRSHLSQTWISLRLSHVTCGVCVPVVQLSLSLECWWPSHWVLWVTRWDLPVHLDLWILRPRWHFQLFVTFLWCGNMHRAVGGTRSQQGVEVPQGQMVCARCHPYECQDERFHSTTLNCNEVITVQLSGAGRCLLLLLGLEFI